MRSTAQARTPCASPSPAPPSWHACVHDLDGAGAMLHGYANTGGGSVDAISYLNKRVNGALLARARGARRAVVPAPAHAAAGGPAARIRELRLPSRLGVGKGGGVLVRDGGACAAADGVRAARSPSDAESRSGPLWRGIAVRACRSCLHRVDQRLRHFQHETL